MIYEMNNQIYLKQGDKYYLANVDRKKHTIAINPTDEYVTSLEGATEVDYYDLKRAIMESTEQVGSSIFKEGE